MTGIQYKSTQYLNWRGWWAYDNPLAEKSPLGKPPDLLIITGYGFTLGIGGHLSTNFPQWKNFLVSYLLPLRFGR
mgnify:FL=1